MVDGLCSKYNALPSEVLKEDVSVLRMLDLLHLKDKKE
tara:strand:+ start:573 stop:686 length:114 start_codon:yes stop_codon:yes gene_type:complete